MPSPRAADDARRTPRPVRPHRAALAVLAAIAAMLTACTSEHTAEPTIPPSASASPTTAPTPTPTPVPVPTRPTAMDDPGADGAEATARYFLDLYAVVGAGDLTEWKSLSHPECIFCTGVSTEVERMVSVGHRQEGPQLTINSVESTEVTPGTFYSIELGVTQGPWRELDAAGTVVKERAEAVEATLVLIVVREGNGWLVRGAESDVAA